MRRSLVDPTSRATRTVENVRRPEVRVAHPLSDRAPTCNLRDANEGSPAAVTTQRGEGDWRSKVERLLSFVITKQFYDLERITSAIPTVE
ncbi:unnamed protein product, partial [Iphiclides podalirius]